MKVGITGGIGSGKSTLCRHLAQMGVAVYDSDSRAKELMAVELRESIESRFGAEAYRDGVLDRKYMAARVFGNEAELKALNAIVHPAVMRDFEQWAERQSAEYVVLESAILFDAALEGYVDVTVAVMAPVSLRIERVCRRDGADAEEVRRRIAAQLGDDTLRERADIAIVNIDADELLETAEKLNQRLTYEARRRNA